jgi:DNA-binding transcriptional regulator YiaG
MQESKNDIKANNICSGITFMLEKTDTGFSSYCEEYPIFSTGESMTGLISNVYEASELYFSASKEAVTSADIKFEIDFKQFFQYYKILNARYLAERIGMNPTLLSQYVQGRKKPSEKQTKKILKGIQQIGKELSELSLISE